MDVWEFSLINNCAINMKGNITLSNKYTQRNFQCNNQEILIFHKESREIENEDELSASVMYH